MKIFEHFQHINLTNDQRDALEKRNISLERSHYNSFKVGK